MEDILEGTAPVKETAKYGFTVFRERLSSISTDHIDKDGNTLLHKLVTHTDLPTPVYILAECGVPVNQLNKEGLSALHLAVKADKVLIAEAILQCGADPNAADKVGVTPATLSSSAQMKAVMNRFQPGLYQAVSSGDFGAVCKLLKSWVSVSSNTLPNSQSIYDCTKSLLTHTTDVYVLKCLQKIRDSQPQSMLIHAVLADNVERAKKILDSFKMRTVNCRYKGERSLLSIALENKNVEMVKVLLDNGVKTNGRVRHRQLLATDCVPCVLLAYSCQPRLEVAQILWEYGLHALHERDTQGNTALTRAVKHGASLEFIQWYIRVSQGQTIAKRNTEKMTAYEVAQKCGRTDITSFINQYISEELERISVSLLVQFYGSLHDQLVEMQQRVEMNGIELLNAASSNDLKTVISYNMFNYQDRNGYTALHKAVASAHVDIVKELAHTRPVLKGMSDNHGRYPLHMAFLLEDNEVRREIMSLLLESNAERYEYACDMNGMNPADYLQLDTEDKQAILHDVITADF